MDKIIEHIRSKYEKLKSAQMLKEENIKVNLVMYVFLAELGYDLDNCKLEEWRMPGECDICVKIPKEETGDKDEYLAIETKSGDSALGAKEIHQLINYMSKETWGVLTNGIQYVLVNNKIDTSNTSITDDETLLLSKVVFWFDLSKARNYDLKYFSYLSKDNIFINKTTTYFQYIAQFKALKFINKENSWGTYKSTLFQFFDYYSNLMGKYRELSRIDTDDFIKFIKLKQKSDNGLPKSITSKKSINNSFSHLNEMFSTLEIKNETFSKGRENILRVFEETEHKKSVNYLTVENISKIITYFEGKESAARNVAIFVLCAYIGMEKPKIYKLKWSSIDLTHNLLLIDNKKIPMCSILVYAFSKLDEFRKKNKIKGDYVFVTYYQGKYKPFQENTINGIFNSIVDIDSNVDMWKIFSPQYVRNCLFTALYESGMYLDEIMFLTGIDLKNIGKYITNQQIIDRQSLDKVLSDKWRTSQKRNRVHPFDEIFNKDNYNF